MALTDSLISWWDLEEASGTRADAHDGHDLTDNNTVGSATGQVGTAADFTAANSEYLSHAHTSALSPTGEISIACWIYRTNSQSFAVAKTLGDTEVEYRIYVAGTGEIWFQLRDDTGSEVSVISGSSVPTSTWAFVCAWYDSSAGEINISIDDGTASTASITGRSTTTEDFYLGTRGSSNFYDGRLDSVGIWSRALTSSERTELYNSGSGVSYSDISGGGGTTMTADQGSYSLTGQTAGLEVGRLLTAEQGTYSLTGQDAALLAFRTLAAGQGTYALTGQDAALLRGLLLAAERGDYTQTGQAATLLASRLLSAEQGSYSLSGQQASLVYSGAGLLAALEVALSDTMTLSATLSDTTTLELTLKD